MHVGGYSSGPAGARRNEGSAKCDNYYNSFAQSRAGYRRGREHMRPRQRRMGVRVQRQSSPWESGRGGRQRSPAASRS